MGKKPYKGPVWVWVVVEPSGFYRSAWCADTKKDAIKNYEAWLLRMNHRIIPFEVLERRLGYRCLRLSRKKP